MGASVATHGCRHRPAELSLGEKEKDEEEPLGAPQPHLAGALNSRSEPRRCAARQAAGWGPVRAGARARGEKGEEKPSSAFPQELRGATGRGDVPKEGKGDARLRLFLSGSRAAGTARGGGGGGGGKGARRGGMWGFGGGRLFGFFSAPVLVAVVCCAQR